MVQLDILIYFQIASLNIPKYISNILSHRVDYSINLSDIPTWWQNFLTF